MVGQGEGLHAHVTGFLHQPVDAAGAVEEAVIGMDVEVDEVRICGRHRARQRACGDGASPQAANAAKKPLTQAGPFDLFLGFSAETHLTFIMPIEIKIRKNEPVDRALRRLKKKLERENIIKDVRAKRYNEKPTERRRRKEKVMAFTQMLRNRHAE
jgi:small subunit ribosomal protein S21